MFRRRVGIGLMKRGFSLLGSGGDSLVRAEVFGGVRGFFSFEYVWTGIMEG